MCSCPWGCKESDMAERLKCTDSVNYRDLDAYTMIRKNLVMN